MLIVLRTFFEMPPYIRIKLPNDHFADCETRLCAAGLSPYAFTRTTIEDLHLHTPPHTSISGSITVRGQCFLFEWQGTSLDIYFAEHNHEAQMALFDELERVFPDPPKHQMVQPTFRERITESLASSIGCLLVIIIVFSVLAFAVYGFITLLRTI